MQKVMVILLVLLMLVFLGGWVALRRFERSMLYHPVQGIEQTPANVQLRYQDVHFVSADGTSLTGWWIPANDPKATVVYCHGNSGNIGTKVAVASEFFKRGFNLLLWDYRGFGQSGGKPSEKGLYEDARSAFDVAAAMSKGLPILLYGHSLGAAVAARTAMDRPAAALILDSGFASAADLARRWYPDWPFDRLLSVSYDTAAYASSLPGLPKLIAHSMQDQVVPFQSGRILHAAAAPPKEFVLLEGEHSDHSWFTPGAPGHAELEAFLNLFKR
ncbi:MAG: alpha/beta hydrolase [Verrucomicrobiota bacterium]|jgi:fermentation-respiration switch protein FrsA (DUF1100 family)|nr:alpha/beta hydrolase [Verrucomicrobiota bacterium]